MYDFEDEDIDFLSINDSTMIDEEDFYSLCDHDCGNCYNVNCVHCPNTEDEEW